MGMGGKMGMEGMSMGMSMNPPPICPCDSYFGMDKCTNVCVMGSMDYDYEEPTGMGGMDGTGGMGMSMGGMSMGGECCLDSDCPMGSTCGQLLTPATGMGMGGMTEMGMNGGKLRG